MSSKATPLEKQLVSRIRSEGAITFRDFMYSALYDHRHGYYNTERLKIGPGGDYYTSSNVHPAFGAVLAGTFVEMRRELCGNSALEDAPVTLVEIGAGTGQLASDIITTIRDEHPQSFDHLRYLIVEASPAMRARQKEMLREFENLVEWRSFETLETEPVEGIAFSNEFVDALPVHLCRCAGGLQEAYVGVRRDQLSIEWRAPSTPALAAFLAVIDVELREHQTVEINLDAIEWLGSMARALRRGFLVTIDYGDVAAHMYGSDRNAGTLRSFHKHRLTESLLERVGEQDITASVSFTALMEYGRQSGFETVSFERQAAFLMRRGLIERVAAMMSSSSSLDDLKDRIALKNLFVPGGASDNFRVLIQRRVV